MPTEKLRDIHSLLDPASGSCLRAFASAVPSDLDTFPQTAAWLAPLPPLGLSSDVTSSTRSTSATLLETEAHSLTLPVFFFSFQLLLP